MIKCDRCHKTYEPSGVALEMPLPIAALTDGWYVWMDYSLCPTCNDDNGNGTIDTHPSSPQPGQETVTESTNSLDCSSV